MIILTCKSVWYYSSIDEEFFFEWIKRIPSITHYKEEKDNVFLYVDSDVIDDNSLRELLAIFYKYKIDMKQLAVFLNKENGHWFFDRKKAYWHKRVFG